MPVPSVLIPDDAAIAHNLRHGIAPTPLPRRRVYLGRIRPKARPQCLHLASYLLTRGAMPPPASVDYGAKAATSINRMYLNDTYGDCVIAGKAHELGVWSANDADSGGVVLATDQEIYRQYESICGPGDNGCVITDVLDVMKEKGFIAGGKAYPIDGYVAVDWTNKLEVQVALYLFGALTLGINLPEAWTEGGDGSTWDVTNTGIVGGHDVTAFGYDSRGVWIATWGGRRLITWAAFTSSRWIEECYAQLAPLWYGNDKLAPCGVDAHALKADLELLGSGTIPSIDPTPVPPLPVPPPSPPVPPSPPAPVNPNYSGTATLSGNIHMPFGGTQQVTFTGPVNLAPSTQLLPEALEHALESAFKDSQVQETLRARRAAGPIPAGILVKIIVAVAPVVIADLAAGKTVHEMIPDIISAILTVLASA
jgi:hypothetical protein